MITFTPDLLHRAGKVKLNIADFSGDDQLRLMALLQEEMIMVDIRTEGTPQNPLLAIYGHSKHFPELGPKDPMLTYYPVITPAGEKGFKFAMFCPFGNGEMRFDNYRVGGYAVIMDHIRDTIDGPIVITPSCLVEIRKIDKSRVDALEVRTLDSLPKGLIGKVPEHAVQPHLKKKTLWVTPAMIASI